MFCKKSSQLLIIHIIIRMGIHTDLIESIHLVHHDLISSVTSAETFSLICQFPL